MSSIEAHYGLTRDDGSHKLAFEVFPALIARYGPSPVRDDWWLAIARSAAAFRTPLVACTREGANSMSSERLGVIGVGYVGLVTAACFAQSGFDVTCLDIDEAKLARLRAGETPIHEPGMQEVLAGSRERLTFTSSAAELFARADIAFVCVDTPPSASGDADLSRVESVLEAIPAGTTNAVLVMKSTVPPGTGARLRRALDERGLTRVAYASNPEFLREGSAIMDFLHPDRVVVGADEPAVGERVAGLYRAFGGSELITDVTSAEMIKRRLERVPGDQDLVHQRDRERLRGGRRERRRGRPRDGPRCPHRVELPAAGPRLRRLLFPKDVAALKQLAGNSGYHFQLLSAVIEVNELQKRRAVAKLKRHLGSLRDRRIALWGLAFKPDTDDMREASSVVLAARLIAEGAEVAGYDPVVSPQQAAALLPRGIQLADSALAAAGDADAVVIVTEWPEFAAPFADGTLLPVMRTAL